MPGQEREYKKCANCTIISNKTIKFTPTCGHVICTDCYPNDPPQRAASYDRSKCPVCQQILLSPNERPKSCFRTLRLFGYIRDCLLEKAPPDCRSCSDGQTKATARCENCLRYLCKDCADPHIKQGTLDDQHYVHTFTEIRLGQSKRSARCETTCCDEQDEGLELTKFCARCEISFCDACASEHQHDVVDLAEGVRACIDKYAEKMDVCALDAATMAEKVTKERRRNDSEYEKRRRKIEEHADDLIAKIVRERDEALKRLTDEVDVHEYHQKPLEDSLAMSEAQITALKASIGLAQGIVDEDQALNSHLIKVFTFVKANTKAIEDIAEAISRLNNNTNSVTPHDVIINHESQVMLQRLQIFATLPRETLNSVLEVNTRIQSDSYTPHVVSMDAYNYKNGCNIFIADADNCKAKVFNLMEEDGNLVARLHKANIGAQKEPAVVFQDSVRDERNQLTDAVCILYSDNSDPGSYHKLEDVLQPFNNIRQLQTVLKVKSVGTRYVVDGQWNKLPTMLKLSESVAREGIQQGYFIFELLNTLRIELHFSRCIEGSLFAISGYHRPTNRSIVMIGCRERPLRVIRFDHDTPGGVAIDSRGNTYYADHCNDRILVMTRSSEMVHTFTGLKQPIDICVLRQSGHSPDQLDSSQEEEIRGMDKAEYMVVVERQGGLKVFDLRQIAERGQFM